MSINHPVFYAVLMIIAGIGIPLMATINTNMGVRLQNPGLATVLLITVALISAVIVALVSPAQMEFSLPKATPKHFYLAGTLFMFYISTISWVAPKFGMGNAIIFVLLGQLISMCVIDHFGLFDAVQFSFNWKRLLGILLMITGIYLIVKRN